MSIGAGAIHSHNAKVGTCPHGLPLGACPICNGMAGGNSTTKRDIPRNVGEMTYNQCAAIGAMLRAQKHSAEQAKLAQQNHLEALANFQKTLASTHQRLMDLALVINNYLPPVLAKPINFVINNIVARVVTLIQNLPNSIVGFVQNICQKFTDITDKLTAMYGELKASISDKISKFTIGIKKKLKSIFFVFGTDETDDEDKKVEEAKRTFELKTFLHKLAQKLKNQNEKELEKDEH